MPGRKYAAGTKYRYGFNGKENDNEVKGEANQQDYGMRIYDPRLGKFLSVDPLTGSYPWYTPYQFAGNKPIWATDLDGLEENTSSNYVYRPPVLYKPAFQGVISITDATAQNVHKTFEGDFSKLAKWDPTKLSLAIVNSLTGSNVGTNSSRLDIVLSGTSPARFSKSWKGVDRTYYAQYSYTLVSNGIVEKGTFEAPIATKEASARIWDPLTFVVLNKVTTSLFGLVGKTAAFKITEKVIFDIRAHIVRFGLKAENEVMMDRMKQIASGKLAATEIDINFAKHELRESELMRAGKSYDEAHEAVLKEQNMFYRGYQEKLYTKEAIKAGDAQMEREVANPKK